MIGRLAEAGFLRHTPYKGVELTEKGAQVALEVMRHHRLWEAFLHRALTDQPMTMFGDGSVVRDYLYAGDLADLVVRLVGLGGIGGLGDEPPIPLPTGEVVR